MNKAKDSRLNLYNNLFQVVSLAINDGDYLCHKDNQLRWAYNLLTSTIQKIKVDNLDINIQDLEEQFRLFFLESLKAYKKKRPCVNIKNYMIRQVTWKMRDWFIKSSKIISYTPLSLKDSIDFIIDLRFLLYGSTVFPFSELSPYERYLIFLRYHEDKTITDIGRIVSSKWETIRNQLDLLYLKCRN